MVCADGFVFDCDWVAEDPHHRGLVGRRALYRVQLDSPETDLDGFHAFGCRSADPADERGVVFLRFEAWGAVPAFTAYTLRDAVRVR